jgi:hypothetical protein
LGYIYKSWISQTPKIKLLDDLLDGLKFFVNIIIERYLNDEEISSVTIDKHLYRMLYLSGGLDYKIAKNPMTKSEMFILNVKMVSFH